MNRKNLTYESSIETYINFLSLVTFPMFFFSVLCFTYMELPPTLYWARFDSISIKLLD